MKIAVLECFAGISGDMTLGALIDCGVPIGYLRDELSKLNLSGWKLHSDRKAHHHIQASHVIVEVSKSHRKNRHYFDIVEMIDNSYLQQAVKDKSKIAFKILATAEAKIHGVQISKVHFHEVGAIDSIIDLIGSIIGFEYLKVDRIYHTAVPLGTGFTKTEHGTMPVPSPAAIEILKGRPLEYRASGYEMTTPTGATIIKTLTERLPPEQFIYTAEQIGYGAGNTQTDLWPNILRLIIGHSELEMGSDHMIMVETNIDDMNPEIYPFLMERVFKNGARDAFLTQVIMKKGRPGILLSVLTEPQNLNKIEREIILHTTTLGIRKYPVNRVIACRRSRNIKTEFGTVRVKSINLHGKEIFRPEFEECKRIAEKNKLSILEVYQRIEKYSGDSDG